MSQQIPIRAVMMRGGTSRGLFFLESDLPADRAQRDRILLAAFGSPDPRQIDGMGGSYSTTSKCAIIGPGTQPGIDINYTFAQVSVTAPLVDGRGNCGNISAAVGPFAIDEGLVPAREPVTVVRILNTNTGKVIEAEVPVIDGRAAIDGDCEIAGVPGMGARIRLAFVEPAGSVTGRLLPTGRPCDVLEVPGLGPVAASLVDAGNPVVFVRARDAGLTGLEAAEALDAAPGALDRLEHIRGAGAVAMGLVDDPARAAAVSPAVPKIALVTAPADFETAAGRRVLAGEVDLVARILSMGRAHRAYAITGALATAAAAGIAGTLVAEAAGRPAGAGRGGRLRLGHPAGVMALEVVTGPAGEVLKVVVERTARRLMDGQVYVPARIWQPARIVEQ
jgi:2-methylaconitate cis-trans-isomerase PrpF